MTAPTITDEQLTELQATLPKRAHVRRDRSPITAGNFEVGIHNSAGLSFSFEVTANTPMTETIQKLLATAPARGMTGQEALESLTFEPAATAP